MSDEERLRGESVAVDIAQLVDCVEDSCSSRMEQQNGE
jgi:hypothetical protein